MNLEFQDDNCFAYAFMSHVVDPNIIAKAIEGLNNTEWKVAMNVEYNSFSQNWTWKLVMSLLLDQL
jgi:hypothetical protein